MNARVKFGPGKYKMRGGRDAVVVAIVNGVAIGYVDSIPVKLDHGMRELVGTDPRRSAAWI